MSAKKSGPPSGLLYFSVFNEIGIIDQLAQTALERALPHGLTRSQFALLNHFALRGGMQSPAELATAFQVTRGAMTNTVQRLAAKGLLDVVDDPKDGRAKKVGLTAAGRRVRDEAIAALGPMFRRMSEAIPADAFERLLEDLRPLRMWMDAARDD